MKNEEVAVVEVAVKVSAVTLPATSSFAFEEVDVRPIVTTWLLSPGYKRRLFVEVAHTLLAAPEPASEPQEKVPVAGLYKTFDAPPEQSVVKLFWKN
jgi:hypothetical protein